MRKILLLAILALSACSPQDMAIKPMMTVPVENTAQPTQNAPTVANFGNQGISSATPETFETYTVLGDVNIRDMDGNITGWVYKDSTVIARCGASARCELSIGGTILKACLVGDGNGCK